MPIYEYECSKCDGLFEKLVASSNTKVICPQCNSGRVKRLVSSFSAHGSSASVPCESGACPGSGVPAGACASGQCPFS